MFDLVMVRREDRKRKIILTGLNIKQLSHLMKVMKRDGCCFVGIRKDE